MHGSALQIIYAVLSLLVDIASMEDSLTVDPIRLLVLGLPPTVTLVDGASG